MSNKDRIRKKAEEAKAAKKSKAAKKTKKTVTKKPTTKKPATKKPTTKKKVAKAPGKAATTRAKKTPARVRLKYVWAVCNPSGKILKQFPYPEKAAAEAEAARLTKSKRSEHKVRPEKVPMEDD